MDLGAGLYVYGKGKR